MLVTQVVRRAVRGPERARHRAVIGLLPLGFPIQAGVGRALIMVVCGGSFDCR